MLDVVRSGEMEERMMIRTSGISFLWLAVALFCFGLTLGLAGQDGSDATIFADFLASPQGTRHRIEQHPRG